MELGEDEVAAAWDANAATWVAHVRAGYDRYRELFTLPAFLAFAPDLAGREVIDLGCGEGSNTRALARRGARMTGVDLSSKMIAAARAKEAEAPLGIVYREGSFTRLDGCADASFDAAVSTMALMDSPDFAATASAVHRVLRPGGGFWLSVLHPCFVTPGLQWLRDAAGNETGLTVADYFSDRSYVERWRFSKAPETSSAEPFRVPRFPRRLEDYVSGLCAAGFRITRIAEPRPTAAQCDAQPWLARWRRHAALVLLVAATKP
jgi:SAM-dependent methyltransferase